jgi:hypothetical protein
VAVINDVEVDDRYYLADEYLMYTTPMDDLFGAAWTVPLLTTSMFGLKVKV